MEFLPTNSRKDKKLLLLLELEARGALMVCSCSVEVMVKFLLMFSQIKTRYFFLNIFLYYNYSKALAFIYIVKTDKNL